MSLEVKKAYQAPKSGIFYMIPDAKKEGSYTLYTEVQERGGKDVGHLFLFDSVKKILGLRFKKDLDDNESYAGIPRGRILDPADRNGIWIIAHGGDFPIKQFMDEILSEFSLRDAYEIGKVKLEIDTHEKMSVYDRNDIQSSIGIKYTSTSWTKVKNK